MMKRYTHYVTLIFKKLSLIIPVVKRTFVQKNIVNSTKSSNFFYTSALALLFLMIGVGSASGATYFSVVTGGNWNTAATWSATHGKPPRTAPA